MTDLSELIERVRAATGPDRALSAAVHFAVLGDDVPYYDTLHCTASVDAALSLPTFAFRHAATVTLTYQVGGAFHSCSVKPVGANDPFVVEGALTPALAITLATLLALQATGAK